MSYFFGNKIQTAVSHPVLRAIFCNTFFYEIFEHAKIGGVTVILIA